MEIHEILDYFAKKVEYDREQKCFNLLSTNYEFHKACQDVDYLVQNEYDRYGYVSVLYLKKAYETILKQIKVNLLDLFSGKDDVTEERELYDLFQSETVLKAEKDVTSMLRSVTGKIEEGKRLGESDITPAMVLDSLERVVKNLKRLRLDVIKAGGAVGELKSFDTSIHIFQTYGECVTAMENAEDGLHLCYIDACRTADGFFAVIIRSGETLLSVNDRINESYIGQHGVLNQRNGRWAEKKAELFPYNFIFEYSDYDHKGCAHTYMIDKEKCSMSAMGEQAYMPIVLTLYLLSQKYEGYMPEKEKQVYISSLLRPSREMLQNAEHALVPLESSALAEIHNNINLNFDRKSFLDGTFINEFTPPEGGKYWDGDRVYTKYFRNNDELIAKYGGSFVPDLDSIFTQSAKYLLQDGGENGYVPEYVGTEQSFRNQMYFSARKQLAEHILSQMKEEYDAFGGGKKVIEWYRRLINDRLDILIPLCIAMEEIQDEEKKKEGKSRHVKTYSEGLYIASDMYGYTLRGGISDEPASGSAFPINPDYCWSNTYCSVTGNRVNKWFWLAPNTANGISYLTGVPLKDIPSFLQKWNISANTYFGNPLLDRVDYVAGIGNLFEKRDAYCLRISLGFSKRGWNKIKKKYKDMVTEEMKALFTAPSIEVN